MRANGIRARHKRRFKATTDSNHSLPVAPNRLEQNFSTERPDQVWTADITYIATGEGWLYLAMVLDLHTRQIVGWAMRERMTEDLVFYNRSRRHSSLGGTSPMSFYEEWLTKQSEPKLAA